MPDSAYPLDVFLRGDRNYVQGTQMIARAADQLPAAPGWLLASAKFDRITDKVVKAAACTGDPAGIGEATFAGGEGSRTLCFVETVDNAPRRDLAMPIRIRRESRGTSSCYEFEHASSFEDGLNVIVQTTKAEHDHIAKDPFDVWLTGLRNFQIPLEWPKALIKGFVHLTLRRTMKSAVSNQSLWDVSVGAGEDTAPIRGIVTFAYKSKDD